MMKLSGIFILLLFSHCIAANEPDCDAGASAYSYGFSVDDPVYPRLLDVEEASSIDTLFTFIASKRQRHGRLVEFYCRTGNKVPAEFRVSSSVDFDHEKLLFIRSDATSEGKSASFTENLRLKIDEGYLQLWGLHGGTGIDLIRAEPTLLVYREVRRTRRAGGGFNERQVVTEIERKGDALNLREHIYIKNKLSGWRLWQY